MAEQIDRFILPSTGTPQTAFMLSRTPDTSTLQVYRNGILMYPGVAPPSDYSVVGGLVTIYITANDDLIQFVYQVGPQALTGSLTTAQDFIYQALRKIGALRPGYTPSPEILSDAMTEWSLMFDEFNADRLMQNSNPDFVYPVTGPGSASDGNGYTVGPSGADWTGPRPTSIIRANLVQTTFGPQPVYIPIKPISQEQWASLAIRQIPAVNITAVFWYDPQYPLGVFNVFPPLNGNSIELFQWGAYVTPANLAASYAAPPGYENVIVTNLAERLYYMTCTKQMVLERAPYLIISGKAKLAREAVQVINRPINPMPTDYPSGDRPGGFYDSFVTYTGDPY